MVERDMSRLWTGSVARERVGLVGLRGEQDLLNLRAADLLQLRAEPARLLARLLEQVAAPTTHTMPVISI